jgi:hypothetical protein
MVTPGEPIALITLRERAIAHAAKIAALVAVFGRKGVLPPREVLDEIKRLRLGQPVGSDEQDPMEAVEVWLLPGVAYAVEAGGVSADLLTKLHTEMEGARERSQEEGHALAVQERADRLGLPADPAEKMLGALEAQPTVTRELRRRRVVEVWLQGQGRQYRRGEGGG